MRSRWNALSLFFIHLRRDSHAISVTYLKYSTPCSNWAPINPLLQYMNSFFSYRRVSFSLLLSVGGGDDVALLDAPY